MSRIEQKLKAADALRDVVANAQMPHEVWHPVMDAVKDYDAADRAGETQVKTSDLYNVVSDPAIPRGEIHFRDGDKTVGKIVGLATPSPTDAEAGTPVRAKVVSRKRLEPLIVPEDFPDLLTPTDAAAPKWKDGPLNESTMREESRRRIVQTASEDDADIDPTDADAQDAPRSKPCDKCPPTHCRHGGDRCELVTAVFRLEKDRDHTRPDRPDSDRITDLVDRADAAHSRLDMHMQRMDDFQRWRGGVDRDLFDPMGGGVHLAHFVHDLTWSDTAHGTAIINLQRQVQSLTDRIPNSKEWKEKADSRLATLESKIDFLHSDTDQRLLALEAARTPEPLVTDEMVTAFWDAVAEAGTENQVAAYRERLGTDRKPAGFELGLILHGLKAALALAAGGAK